MIAIQWADWLASLGMGTVGTDIFVNFQQDKPDNCITLNDETAPILPESQALAMDQFGLQVIVRNTSSSVARNTIKEIHKAIIGLSGDVGTEEIDDVNVVTSPTTIGRDDKNRSEWTAHYIYRIESEGDSFRT